MNKKKLYFFSIILIVSLVLSIFYSLGIFSQQQLVASDNLYGGNIARDDILIAAIDDKSLQEIGRWPWDRKVFAALFDRLDQAYVVGVDVAFFESSDNESDSILADSIKENSRVIIPVEYTKYSREGHDIIGEDILMPLDILYENALDVGYINVLTDKDGVSRAVNLNVKGDFESFASAVYMHYTGEEYSDKKTRYIVNFVGNPGSFKYYSISDIILGNVKSDEFNDKIVLVGATSPDLHDDYFVPTSNGKAMPGVEMHANTIQTMLDETQLDKASDILTIVSIILACVIAGYLYIKFGPLIASIMNILLIFAYILIAILFFSRGIILNIIYIPLAIFLGQISAVIFSYITEKKEKKELYSAFSRYVSPNLVKDIMKDPSSLMLGGQKKEITILFSDIRGFTTLSEKMNPEELVELLNEYLSEMTEIVLKNKGLVDKFIGDAIMAFWNAPLEEKDHEILACKTAVEMKEKLEELNKKWHKKGLPKLNIGIGIHTGKVIVGNMGSEKRFDYTAIGDDVNLCSRLEGLTKYYGVNIIISEDTKNKIKDEFKLRELDEVKVKGKDNSMKIYEITSLDDESITVFNKGISYYKKGEFSKAISEFNKSKEKGDKTSEVFEKRCRELILNKPKNWDGIWRMDTK